MSRSYAISVIVVSYNTRELLARCLATLHQFEPDAEVIVVDNDSADGSSAMVRERFPYVIMIDSDHNLGFAAANNIGIAASTRPFIVLLNSDTELLDESLSNCVARLESDPRLGAIHPSLIGADGLPQRCVYPIDTFKDSLSVACRQLPRSKNADDETWLVGTALVIRRTALESVGGALDDSYFIYWEDADLSVRLRRAGWTLAVEESAVIRHLGGASGGGDDSARRADLNAWYHYGRHRWFRLHRPWPEAIGIWLLDAIEVPRSYLRGAIRKNRRRQDWANASVLTATLIRVAMGKAPKKITSKPKLS